MTALKMSYGYFLYTDIHVIIHCGKNNVDQHQPRDIAVEIIKTAETFTKKHSKTNTTITGMLTRDKTYSFRVNKNR